MKASQGNGKGDLPREGQFSKESQASYGREYERIFGSNCPACKGKGSFLDWNNLTKEMIKTTCIFCNGTGKEKKPTSYTPEQRRALEDVR